MSYSILSAVVAGVVGVIVLSGCSRNPDAAKRAYFDVAKRYAAQGKYPEAIVEYRNAIAIDPNFGEARYSLGQAYMRTGETQSGYREYVRAADLLPDDA